MKCNRGILLQNRIYEILIWVNIEKRNTGSIVPLHNNLLDNEISTVTSLNKQTILITTENSLKPTQL